MKKPRKLSQVKKQSITEAALEMFKANGYQDTSMDAIAARARVSKRTVYNHFKSKQDLFNEVVFAPWQHFVDTNLDIYKPDVPLKTQLLAIAQQKIDFISSPEMQSLFRVVLTECLRSPEMARRIYQRLTERGRTFVTWVGDAAKDGRLKVTDPELAARQFLGQIGHFALWPQVLGGQPLLKPAERRRLAEALTAMFLDHFAPQEA